MASHRVEHDWSDLAAVAAAYSTIKPVNPKGNQIWIFIGRTDAEAETPILWPPDAKSQLIGKDPDAGKDWGQEVKRVTEDEMAGWHHWLNGHEFEQTPGDSEGQGSLVCCSPWVANSWTRLSDWITMYSTKRKKNNPLIIRNIRDVFQTHYPEQNKPWKKAYYMNLLYKVLEKWN